MFGSNLSSIAERKAREGSSKGKTKTDVEAPDIPAASGAATGEIDSYANRKYIAPVL